LALRLLSIWLLLSHFGPFCIQVEVGVAFLIVERPCQRLNGRRVGKYFKKC